MAAYSGFKEEEYSDVFIILDKMDKIGVEGVKEELLAEGYDAASVEKYLGLFEGLSEDAQAVAGLKEQLNGFLDPDVADNLVHIMESVSKAAKASFSMAFDATLVRGMSYYTGPIFEITMDEYGGSVGGGGRYDEMIGKFTGQNTPACGFSVGFERIVMLLLENGYKVPGSSDKKAYLLDKKLPDARVQEIVEKAMQERLEGKQVNVAVMKKNRKFQKDQLAEEGWTEIVEIFE